MNSDAILLAMRDETFREQVEEAFKLHAKFRGDGNMLGLCDSLFAQSSLVQDSLLANEPYTLDAQARGMQALLYWVVSKLKPVGEHNFTAKNWRFYNVLYYPYLAGEDKLTFEVLAEQIDIAVATVYDIRLSAIKAAAQILWNELKNPQDVAGRKHCVIDRRYQAHHHEEQLVLRLLAVLRHAIQLDDLKELIRQAGVSEPTRRLYQITLGGLLLSNEGSEIVTLHPEAYGLHMLMLPEERIRWHRLVAAYYRDVVRNYLEAVYHLREARDDEDAATVLINNYEAIIQMGQIKPFYSLVSEFHPENLKDTTWARLNISAGQAAEMVDDMDTAIEEYSKALGSQDPYLKGLAYYRRAEAFKFKNVDQSLVHYNYGIEFLTTKINEEPQLVPLLMDMYIDKAWLYLQEGLNIPKAEENLTAAQQLVASVDSRRRARLYNALARLSKQQDNLENNVYHMLEACRAADETQDIELMMKMYLNLAMAYVWWGKHDLGLEYMQKSSFLAQQIGDKHFEAKCYKTMAAQCFFQGEYWDSVYYNERAYDIFKRTNNVNWLGHVCHDLAEAYCKLGETNLMQQYFAEATDIANKGGDKELLEYLKYLADECFKLGPPDQVLTPEQLQTYEYVKEHGSIKLQECVDLLGNLSPSTVRRKILAPMIDDKDDQNILVRIGKGPATRYVLKKDKGKEAS